MFEYVAFFTFILVLNHIYILDSMIKNAQKQIFKVNMVKINELASLEDVKSKAKTSIGTKETATVEEDEKIREYSRSMEKLASTIPRIMIDCKSFTSRNKACFMILFVFQLMQSMVFNGIVDLPILIQLLVLCSLYAFRKNYFFLFQTMMMILVHNILIAALFKTAFLSLVTIPFVEKWIIRNKGSKKVQAIEFIFGLDF